MKIIAQRVKQIKNLSVHVPHPAALNSRLATSQNRIFQKKNPSNCFPELETCQIIKKLTCVKLRRAKIKFETWSPGNSAASSYANIVPAQNCA